MSSPAHRHPLSSLASSHHTLPLAILLLLTVIFFLRLFFPGPALFFTPDLGISDTFHLTYPLKDFLSQSIKSGRLPLWNKNIGTGFPVFAESEIGALFLPNLALFGLLPTWLAWNLSYPLLFFTAATGCYFFFYHLGAKRWGALFGSVTFSFGAFFVLHIPHHNMIQAASLMPWLFLLAHRLLTKPKTLPLVFFALLLSQQIFVGHLQTVFITVVGLAIYASSFLALKQTRIVNLLILSLGFVLGLLLAAPQLLPLYQLKQLSFLNQGSDQIFNFPFSPKFFLTFLLPNYFGTPVDGTFPNVDHINAIYWENVHYIGLIPIVLLGFALVKLFKRNSPSQEQVFWILALVSTLLALGKFSPLSFIYQLSGFNWFRVPARFFLITTFSATALISFNFEQVLHLVKRLIRFKSQSFFFPLLLVAGVALDLFNFGYSYNPTVATDQLLAPPQSSQLIPESARLYTFKPLQNQTWNQYFYQGWQDLTPFIYLRNGLDANSNLLWNQPSIQDYTGIRTERLDLFTQLANTSILNTTATEFVITPESLPDQSNLELFASVSPPQTSLPPYNIYKNTLALNRFRFVSHYQVQSQDKTVAQLSAGEFFDFATTAYLESDPGIDLKPLSSSDIKVLRDDHTHLTLQTATDQPALLIIADSYYPGWQATINHQSTPILPTNLNQRALVVPSGDNTISFNYHPTQFYLGLYLAAFTLLVIASLVLFSPRLDRLLFTSPRFFPKLITSFFNRYPDHFAILAILIFVILFFAPLFVPSPKTYFTLDDKRSDIYHYHLPARFNYSNHLKKFSLPLWVDTMSSGYPLYADSQLGAFYLPNLILYYFLPFWLAWNLSYPFAIFLLASGSYFFFKQFRCSPPASLFAALIFSFGGFIITHFIHINMLQTVALMPWIFLLGLKLIRAPSKLLFLTFTLLLSQSVLAGYLQYTFITLVGLALILLINHRQQSIRLKHLTYLALSGLLALGISAVQLLPTYELVSQAGRSAGLSLDTLLKFPLRIPDLIGFVLPNYFGSAVDGSYPPPSDNWGFYWENTVYLGLIPLILALYALKASTKPRLAKLVLIAAVLTLLLALGKSTPFSFVYSLPLFYFFRIPSRFLLLTTLFVCLLSALGLDRLRVTLSSKLRPSKTRYLILTLAALALSQLFTFVFPYNPTTDFAKLLESPPTLSSVPNQSRVFTLISHTDTWNQTYLKSGWQDTTPFLYFKNGLDTNSNLLWEAININFYAGLAPERLKAYFEIFNVPLMNAFATDYLISTVPLEETWPVEQIDTIQPPSLALPPYYVYSNRQALPRFRFIDNYQAAPDIATSISLLNNPQTDLISSAIVETSSPLPARPDPSRQLQVISTTPTHIRLNTNSQFANLLVIADTYYPGWRATINDQPTTIYPANLAHRAIAVPAGNNTIDLTYQPQSFKTGAIISAVSLLLLAITWHYFDRLKRLSSRT